jgi:hypothetical protein
VKSKLRYEYILVVVLVVLALTVRLHEIHYSLDGDEVFSVQLASKQFAEVISGSLRDKPHPPLQNLLLYLWMKAFGVSEASARSLSVLFSAAFLATSYPLFRRYLSPWLALGVLSIVALSPFFVYYGQQARPYALIAFLSTANVLAFLRVLQEPRERKRLAVWAVSCCVLLYAQYLAILLIAVQISVALFTLRSESWRIVAYASAGTVFILPWFIAALSDSISRGIDPSRHVAWMTPPTFVDLVRFYLSVFGETPVLRMHWLLVLLAALGAASIRYRVLPRDVGARHLLLFLIAFGLPAVVYIVSISGPASIFASRQLLQSTVAFVIVIGLCLTMLPRTLAAGFWLILLAWTAASLPTAFPHNTKPPWRDVATKLDEQYASMPVVAQERWVVRPLSYYRTSGSVRLWSDLGEKEKTGRLLFVCRKFQCSEVETEPLQSRRSLVANWRWGSARENGEFNQLFLYEIGRGNLGDVVD